MEDEDGDVVKKYDLPTQKNRPDLVSQGLKYMGMGVFARAADKSGAAAGPSGKGEGNSGDGGESSAQKPRKKGVVDAQDDEDDKHIRFTIGGVGKRMTKEDFILEMQKLDKTTRREVVDRSNASQTVKTLAKKDPRPQQGRISSQLSGQAAISRQDHAFAAGLGQEQQTAPAGGSGSASPSSLRPPSPKRPAAFEPGPEAELETEVERRRRLAVLSGVGGASEETGEGGETPAERRRREAALGVASQAAEEDSDDDDTPRVPPSKRAIRFADAPPRGRT